MPADGVFIYVGQLPNTGFLQNVVELDEWGYIVTDELLRTSQPGVFACGDAKIGPIKQIAWAVGEGALAGIEAEKYLDTMACVQATGATVSACEAGLAEAGGDAVGTSDALNAAGDGGPGAKGTASPAGESAPSGDESPS